MVSSYFAIISGYSNTHFILHIWKQRNSPPMQQQITQRRISDKMLRLLICLARASSKCCTHWHCERNDHLNTNSFTSQWFHCRTTFPLMVKDQARPYTSPRWLTGSYQGIINTIVNSCQGRDHLWKHPWKLPRPRPRPQSRLRYRGVSGREWIANWVYCDGAEFGRLCGAGRVSRGALPSGTVSLCYCYSASDEQGNRRQWVQYFISHSGAEAL